MNLRYFLVFIFFGFNFSWSIEAGAEAGERLKYLPVQDGGRIKPFDSFAQEALELLYGRATFKRSGNADGLKQAEAGKKEPAYLIVMTFMLSPDSWSKTPLFEVNNLELKKGMGLPGEQKHFTAVELFQNEKFSNLMQELANKREAKEKLNPYFQAVQRLENQFYTFRELAAGRHMKVMPSAKGEDSWTPVSQLEGKYHELFLELSQNLARYLGVVGQNGLKSTASVTAGAELDRSVDAFIAQVQAAYPESYQDQTRVAAEVFYNKAHFFRWSYVFYLLGALTLLVVWVRKLDRMAIVWVFALIGLALHIGGFIFRVYLAERPPVTNMYETVVWVSFGAVLFSMILEKIYKFRSILLAGLLTGVFSMVVADMAPAILDPSIQPLEAVLRSNYWLIIHVMTITISYAAFLLAFGLGDIGLIYFILDPKKYAEQIRNISTGIYRSIQIGVAFLAPGIILGGIWADYSWGRFWGWDPKETWALIVLLGYIIVLHAKLINWLQNFGMMVSGVLTFNLVIMAWYGVNFILGAGLHSYGFGAGGVEYVAVFTTLHFLFVGYAAVVKKISPKI